MRLQTRDCSVSIKKNEGLLTWIMMDDMHFKSTSSIVKAISWEISRDNGVLRIIHKAPSLLWLCSVPPVFVDICGKWTGYCQEAAASVYKSKVDSFSQVSKLCVTQEVH